jgi:serine/threonine protein kinase
MGVVYRARDTRLEREVAVKVLPDAFAQDPNRRARFEREAKAVAALSHPNILAIHDYGTHETITYAVMELLEGETLRDRLKKGPLFWREATEIGIAVADGLAAAHAKGILHRDIKPENLFLTADSRVKILDFGLARMTPPPSPESQTRPYTPAATDAGTVMGTVGYMSPEQVRGQPANASSDLFSLGCVLYEMVTGRRAFRGATAAETMTAILRDEPPDPTASVPPNSCASLANVWPKHQANGSSRLGI